MERVLTVGGGQASRPISELLRYPVGNEFYVSSVNGDSDHNAKSAKRATNSIANCLDLMTASNNDVMYLMPGHAETISSAAALALDVAGVRIKGVGWGSLQPTLTFDTATTADMDVDAANIVMENIHFRANFADIAAAIDVNADDFALIDCRFSAVATNMNAKIWIQDALVTASDRISVIGCRAQVIDAANTHFINFAGTGDGHRIIGNSLVGDWGTMAIGGAGIVTHVEITDNKIANKATDNDACINLAATTTGIVMRNLCAGGAAQANGVTAQGCALAENYYAVIGEDLSAILEPIAT